MKKYTAIGLMSGTSMDGIDVALITSDGHDHVERGPSLFVPYDDAMRARITQGLQDAKAIKNRMERPKSLGILEHEITLRHSLAIARFKEKFETAQGDIDLIGFHGQTVLHRPDDATTVQLGDGQLLADITGIDVVYDLRANDMTQNGQGAPLVPVYHRALARRGGETTASIQPVVFVNIGGISNVTYIGNDRELIAFDCGPGNALIDQWVQMHTDAMFDEGGKIGKSGELDMSVCEQYLSHRFFDLPVPKTLDRADFEPLKNDNVSLENGARSLAHVTARSIVMSADHFPSLPAKWVICGGGVMNTVIMDDLKSLLDPIGAKVISADDAGFSSMAMEAEAFAYLAIRSKLGLDLTWPKTTGCTKPSTGGILCTPENGSARIHA